MKTRKKSDARTVSFCLPLPMIAVIDAEARRIADQEGYGENRSHALARIIRKFSEGK